ncbi:helix-turn-helix domain-containing protein [Paenibacillus alkaliterrae]|nr:helix-turn-helix domain-containing protein [Paenibacillus alkaliterrae]
MCIKLIAIVYILLNEQATLIRKTIGCARYVFNHFLQMRER